MQETDEDKEGKLPRQEIWQREDEESLTPIDIEVEEGQELDTNQEAPAGYVMEETDVHPDSGDLDEESTDEMISIGTNPDEVMNQIDEFTSDPEVLEDFSERQELNIGSDQLLEKLIEHHSKKPALSAGDIDAAWEDTDASGEGLQVACATPIRYRRRDRRSAGVSTPTTSLCTRKRNLIAIETAGSWIQPLHPINWAVGIDEDDYLLN
jgi:hypothetical protein